VSSQSSRTGWYSRGTRETKPDTTPAAPPLVSHRRRLRYLEVFSLAIAVCLIVGVDIYIFKINKRLGTLENEIAEARTWAIPASLLEGKYTSLNVRVRALSEALNSIETRLATQEQQGTLAHPSVASEPRTAGNVDLSYGAPAAGIARPASGRVADSTKDPGVASLSKAGTPGAAPLPAIPQPRDADERSTDIATPEMDSTAKKSPTGSGGVVATPGMATNTKPGHEESKTGRWVINLLSDPNSVLAGRFAIKARNHGIPVEQQHAEVKGQMVWRVQITGFATQKEARAHAQEVKEKLHLKEVWIFRQPG